MIQKIVMFSIIILVHVYPEIAAGGVFIDTPLTEGPYEFKSVSGSVSLITPEDTSCTIYMKSVSGPTKINLPVTDRSGASKQKQIIEVAGGGPEVRMKSVSGVLKIGSDSKLNNETHSQQEEVKNDLQSDAVEAVDPQAETELPSKTQMEILQEIENGELSVDEALKQLNP